MFIVEIQFPIPEAHDPSDVERSAWSLLAAWFKNGQVYKHYHLFAAPAGGLRAIATIPEETALDDVHADKSVENAMAKFCADGRAPPMVEIKGEESEAVRPCACESRKNLVLITDFVSSESPVKCLDCYGVVPLYRLPNFAHIEGLLFWQGDYKACDTLQIGCTTGERFALREMDRADSTLSRNGRDLCKTIEESSGIPTYYYLHKYYGRSHAQEWKRRCPSCVGPWLMPKRIEPIFDFRCDRCRLLSNIAFSLGAG